MTTGKYFHIFLQPAAHVSLPQVEEKMNLAIDWYKYSAYTWIVFNVGCRYVVASLTAISQPGRFGTYFRGKC